MLKKYSMVITLLLMACSLSLTANTKSAQENEKKDKSKSKEEVIFDSCDKKDIKKCDKGTKGPVSDYSKFIK